MKSVLAKCQLAIWRDYVNVISFDRHSIDDEWYVHRCCSLKNFRQARGGVPEVIHNNESTTSIRPKGKDKADISIYSASRRTETYQGKAIVDH
jgi:hypothetical protein